MEEAADVAYELLKSLPGRTSAGPVLSVVLGPDSGTAEVSEVLPWQCLQGRTRIRCFDPSTGRADFL